MTSSEPPISPEQPAEPEQNESGPPELSPDPLVLQSLNARLRVRYLREELSDASSISIGIVPGDGPHLPHTKGGTCWCQPELFFEDPEAHDRVWIHRRIQ
jgi:hypothetical protein